MSARPIRKSRWLPELLFVLSATVLGLAWVQLRNREQLARDLELRLHAEHVAARLQVFLDDRTSALATLRDGWLVQPPSEERFAQLAETALRRFPGFAAINWVDRDRRIQWVYPPEPNAAAKGRSLAGHPIAGPAVERAAKTLLLSATPQLDLLQGGRGFTVYLPVVRDGILEGFINGVFRTSVLLESTMTHVEPLAIRLVLLDGEDTVMEHAGTLSSGEPIVSASEAVTLADRRWSVVASGPKDTYLLRGWADEALLGSGLALAFLFFVALRSVIRRRDALAASEARYRTLVDHAPEAIIVVDADSHQVEDVNQNAVELFGRAKDELIGTPLEALTPQAQLAFESIDEALAGGTPAHEWTIIGPGGDKIPTELRWVRLPGHRPHVRGSVTAVSDRLERERAVKDSEARLRQVLESTQDGVLVTDATGRASFANHRLLEILETRLDAVIGRPLEEVLVFGEAHPPPLDVRDSGQLSMERELVRGDGTHAFVAMQMLPIHDESGTQTGTLTLLTDLSEARSLEAQLRHAQKMEAIGRLAGGIAHDFNNLLMGILTACELLEPNVDEADRELVREMDRCGRRAARLTSQLLTFSRKDVAQPRVVEISTLVGSVESMLARVISEKIRIDIQCSRDVGAVHIDPGQLEQVLLNLAVNASDAMPGGGKLTIRVTDASFEKTAPDRPLHLAHGRHVRITVSDTGEGILPEHRDKIFDPFFTTKGPGHGTGLGLSTVHGIVTGAGGAITVDSLLGKGTTFTIFLPVTDAMPAEPTGDAAAGPRSTSKGRETILIVEDEASVRHVLERALAGAGYDVLVADSASKALSILESERRRIHLVVSDVVMPDMSGPELAEAIRRLRPDLEFLYISGYSADALPPEIATVEGQLLKKPFTAAQLTACVRERLDGAHAARDLVG